MLSEPARASGGPLGGQLGPLEGQLWLLGCQPGPDGGGTKEKKKGEEEEEEEEEEEKFLHM